MHPLPNMPKAEGKHSVVVFLVPLNHQHRTCIMAFVRLLLPDDVMKLRAIGVTPQQRSHLFAGVRMTSAIFTASSTSRLCR